MARSNPFLRQGLPMILLVVAGSVGLSTLMAGKQEIGDARKQRRNLTQREYDMEEDYKKTLAKLNLEQGYDVVRIPRPPDETEP